jgi:hypothetical protein
MREIATEATYPYHRSYPRHEGLILDVWYVDPGQIVIYFETVIDEPHDDPFHTFLVDDRRLYTKTTSRLRSEVPSWEAFLADPRSYLMEAML